MPARIVTTPVIGNSDRLRPLTKNRLELGPTATKSGHERVFEQFVDALLGGPTFVTEPSAVLGPYVYLFENEIFDTLFTDRVRDRGGVTDSPRPTVASGASIRSGMTVRETITERTEVCS